MTTADWDDAPTLIFDGTRLFWGALARTPRGIDRVDFGVARVLASSWTGTFISVVSTPWGLRVFSRESCLKHLAILSEIWREDCQIRHDARLRQVVAWLNGSPSLVDLSRWGDIGVISRVAKVMWSGRFDFGRAAGSIVGHSIYLNLGQSTFGRPDCKKWLDEHTSAVVVAMVHDVIPLTHQNLVTATSVTAHTALMKRVLEDASLIIAPSLAAAEDIGDALSRLGGSHPPIEAIGLPLDDIFFELREQGLSGASIPKPQRRYFVAGGSIEPRKNQRMLLDVWRKLVPMHGKETPLLVLAGNIGEGSKDVIDLVNHDPILRGHVVLAQGLSSPGLAWLIAHSEAFLMPSKAEGFGLQPLEAIALRTLPVISDLPSHLEGTAGLAVYIDPNRPDDWLKVVSTIILNDPIVARWRASLDNIQLFHWKDFADRLVRVILDRGNIQWLSRSSFE